MFDMIRYETQRIMAYSVRFLPIATVASLISPYENHSKHVRCSETEETITSVVSAVSAVRQKLPFALLSCIVHVNR